MQPTTPPTKVKLNMLPEEYALFGFTPESVVTPSTFTPVDGYKDEKGNNIYLFSALRNRLVWLASNKYEVVE